MPVGKQDWAYVVENMDNEQVSDYAELAARLGSIYTHYRTGNYVWSTSFESGDNSYRILNTGTGTIQDYGTLTQSGANAKQILLVSTDTQPIYIERWEPFLVQKGIGFSYSIKAPSGMGDHHLVMRLIDDGFVYPFTLHYDAPNFVWEVFNGSTYDSFLTQKINDRAPDNYYDRIKMVVDLESKHYINFIINGAQHDISAYQVSGSAVTTSEVAQFYMQCNVPASGSNNFYLDDFIITQNEPIS